jgi:hypothetical protein
VLAALLEGLLEQHNGAVCGVLLYGSCLRSGELYDGLIDLYLICDDYRSACRSRLAAAGNWLLPPNVFYAEQAAGERVMRSKVSLVSLRDFRRACSPARFESYFWGRFAQPVRLLYWRDDGVREALEQCLLQACATLLQRALPALPAQGALETLWQGALGLSYATELRSERGGRAAQLAGAALPFYAAVTRHHAASGALPLALSGAAEQGATLRYSSDVRPAVRRRARGAWALRRIQGKVLSLLRLLKALFTFEGGLDYIAWKLTRHSGQEVVIPERVRRAPLIFVWGFIWQLYRRGVIR